MTLAHFSEDTVRRYADNNLDPKAFYGPGAYCYGAVMRHMASLFPKYHWRHKCYTQEYSDDTLGEILEAVLGAAWTA